MPISTYNQTKNPARHPDSESSAATHKTTAPRVHACHSRPGLKHYQRPARQYASANTTLCRHSETDLPLLGSPFGKGNKSLQNRVTHKMRFAVRLRFPFASNVCVVLPVAAVGCLIWCALLYTDVEHSPFGLRDYSCVSIELISPVREKIAAFGCYQFPANCRSFQYQVFTANAEGRTQRD